jgi:ABC-type glycerol-3-phosphate transport system permease component
LPISIWILKGYLDSIPIDLEEAAMVDGCNRLQALWRVVLPLALPGIIGTGTFAFMWAWNEFMFAVVLTSGPDAAPLTIAIAQFFTQFGREWNAIMALNVVATLPLLIIFVFLQRWVVQGMTAGAVK